MTLTTQELLPAFEPQGPVATYTPSPKAMPRSSALVRYRRVVQARPSVELRMAESNPEL
jgi:hypothetical protein